jgi:serine/threonine protein kinase
MDEASIFLEALEKPLPDERAAFLDQACGGNAELRRSVELLLRAHDKAGGFLADSPAPLGVTVDQPVPENLGTVIGPYKLIEQIGEGGMGAVWMAQQTEPVKRLVAIKLVKAGMDSRQVIARFEAERQALALMDHPNIARVLDAGTTGAGRPYFVMDLVKGVPITKYCDEHHLTPRQRLELFIPVCQAVQHAHQKGIIHRDLKPSNVLVALYDGKPVPKVIDFGVAKAAGQQLTDKTLVTGFGNIVGTLEYMSPEQAEVNQLDIDTRSDVYSLGVLLYELLAGSPPFSRKELERAGLLEMLRVIREVEPSKPSTKLSTAEGLPTLAANRGTEPAKLTRLVRGELDWIVMKALEKDRNRRYETANGFAADVLRYLAGERVSAVPPSAGYRMRKFLRKNRRLVTAVLLVFLALVAGMIGTTTGLLEARRQRNAALQAEAVADQRRRQVERNAASLQVDLDLDETHRDSRLGLLRLARTLKRLPAHVKELHEFATIGVLAFGQKYAPLLPPITHDGYGVRYQQLSTDARTLITLGDDGTARLWDTHTARPIAVLRRVDERVVACAFSPDGRTVATDSEDGVLRFWNLPNGTFRAKSEPRPDRYGRFWLSEKMDELNGDLLLSASRVITQRYYGEDVKNWGTDGPFELWDTMTGRLIARLDRPDDKRHHFRFVAEGRWVTAIEEKSTVVVFSSDDGREIARLSHPGLQPNERVEAAFSPSGRWVVTQVLTDIVLDPVRNRHEYKHRFYTWEPGTWRRLPGSIASKVQSDLAVCEWNDFILLANYLETVVYRPGQAEPLARLEGGLQQHLAPRADATIPDTGGVVFDLLNGRRRIPPPGRRFHPDLARFAPDGRFVAHLEDDEVSVIDVLTDKCVDSGEWYNDSKPLAYRPGFGMVGILWSWRSSRISHAARILLVPTPPPDIPTDLLELWAQVAVRGEIGPDGNFAKWDEPTWERKRQELAARPAPSVNFPFPGYVVTDRLHWLRSEFDHANADADKLHLARQLLGRAEAAGDQAEAVRWRTQLNKLNLLPEPPR